MVRVVYNSYYWFYAAAHLSLRFVGQFLTFTVWIHLDVLFHVFRFSKVSFNALTSSIHNILKLCPHLGTETYRRLPCQFCNFTWEITNESRNFTPTLRSNLSWMILSSKLNGNNNYYDRFSWKMSRFFERKCHVGLIYITLSDYSDHSRSNQWWCLIIIIIIIINLN